MNLTQREINTLEVFAAGYSYCLAADKLETTEGAVMETMKQLRKKTKTKNSVELVAKAIREGWIK